jgi:hypothetical protein
MTNKEIAQKVTNIVFEQKDNSPDCEAFALQLFIEALNCPSKYSHQSIGYRKEDMEQAILDLLKDVRFNGIHYMDLSESFHTK